ncbi:MAG: hypothetical protein H0W73_14155 [Bacteroidetes bacterium]|nr:hypothetical protein [Bacteroidota bacterium]
MGGGTAFFWHLFRPSKLIDHFSLLFFKIKSDNLPHSVYSILESNLEGKIKSIQGLISRIIDLETASGVKIAKELQDIRTNNIFEINQAKEKDLHKDAVIPIDKILSDVTTHFYSQSKFKIKDFKMVVNNEKTVDIIIKLFKDAVYEFNKTKNV